MNILLTNKCNRKCPYCFAQERISYPGHENKNRADPFITKANFEKAAHFAKKSNVPVVGILGGEPSLHPAFLDLLQSAWNLKLHTKIFTNGLWDEAYIDFFKNGKERLKEKSLIIVNVNQPEESTQFEKNAQAKLLSQIGYLCTLSFNIYREDFDPLFLIDYINKHKCKRLIRLGMAQPLAKMSSNFVEVDRYKSISKTIMKLAEECDRNDIRINFDCGFTLCMFSETELGRLMLANARFKSDCDPAIDIGTDLSVWACFPLSTFSSGMRLDEFEHIKNIADFFKDRFKRLYNTGSLDECVSCKYRKRKQCSGGCAAHVFRRFNP
jgi:MoaA/NifB/PqqE/SkfB family radical SAM enzyme